MFRTDRVIRCVCVCVMLNGVFFAITHTHYVFAVATGSIFSCNATCYYNICVCASINILYIYFIKKKM